jgi:hypothetical protein
MIFHAMALIVLVFFGWFSLAIFETGAHRGMLKMIKKVAFDWLGGTLLGLLIMSGPILDFVLHR